MSSKYKFIDKKGVYFTTSTVAGWVDIFFPSNVSPKVCALAEENVAQKIM